MIIRSKKPGSYSRSISIFCLFFLLVCPALFTDLSHGAVSEPVKYEDDDVNIRLFNRTPEQLAAFYIGRGFKQPAIEKIQETCFVTVIIKNRNIEVLWLELDNWVFSRQGELISRINREYWKKRWQETGLPLNHQSTFGWTLLPEVRDLRLHESVGGNVVIPMQASPFDLEIVFKTGPDKTGKVKKVVFQNVSCGVEK